MFSTGSTSYTTEVLKRIDPTQRFISAKLEKEQCILRNEEAYLKDLRVLEGRSLERTVIVDCQAFAFQSQLDNGIYVPAYFGDDDDNHLLTIQKFLMSLEGVDDVRPLVKKFAGISRLLAIYSTQRPDESPAAVTYLEPNTDLSSDDDWNIANEFQQNT